MDDQYLQPDPAVLRRVELLLDQIDELPTLGAVALRLLELTADDEADVGEIIEMVGSDPSIAGKVLAMCRCAARGRVRDVTSIERAVLLLGFDAVRSAVLSVQVFEVCDTMLSAAGQQAPTQPRFNRVAYWQHSLAVAMLCEGIAGRATALQHVMPGEAFLSGLLHDIGMLALHVLLPESFDRVCRFAEAQGISLNQACSRVIGLDANTAGKRLASHWQLPASLVDTLWLHGQPSATLPDVPHKAQIQLVTLADAIARQQYIAPMGHSAPDIAAADLCAAIGIEQSALGALAADLHAQVTERASHFGLDIPQDDTVLLHAISRANAALGRANASLRARARIAQQQTRIINAIREFHQCISADQSVMETLASIVRSASSALGGGDFAMLFQPAPGQLCELTEFTRAGRPTRTQMIDRPAITQSLREQMHQSPVSTAAVTALPWLLEHLEDVEPSQLRLVPLKCDSPCAAALLMNNAEDTRCDEASLDALSCTWAMMLSAATYHASARHVSEQLAESNRYLVEAQQTIARNQTMAALGEIAAGAAHEMNNPDGHHLRAVADAGRCAALTRTAADRPADRGADAQTQRHDFRPA
jgi:HD-like signal output (HDOD) protein